MDLVRCGWSGSDPLYQQYHDEEWGVPTHDDRHLFEMICLEGAQAGLSWITILRKRAEYRVAFDEFDAEKIARYDEHKIAALLENPGIVRNRLKVNGFVRNARAFLLIQEKEAGGFSTLLWRFVGGAPIINHRAMLADIPAQTAEAVAMSKELKRRDFTFVGPTICYAFMQATGMVNDHTVNCFRHPDQQR